ncbi:hypothetical protein THOD03_420009 [Vibrio harveyi]|nr:hypothetical protein TH15OA1_550009 [Vibrio harveyi]CAH1572326.1 hypothetical protein THOD03_420009 [Vibrio harveyi]
MKDESWLEEKRTELPYFHRLQIRKGFNPRTPTAALKENKIRLESPAKVKKRQRNRIRVRNRKR